ncbi:MAG: signal peptidase II [Verrucomicrobiota bacterium]
MSDSANSRKHYPTWTFYVLLVGIYIFDQATKAWILRDFWLGKSVEVIPGFLNWTYVRNDGIAFGMFQGNNTLMAILVLFVCGIAIWWATQLKWEFKIVNVFAGLIAAGAVGNLTDRFRLGYVVDFVDADLGFMRWPAFNVADSAICVAVVLMLYCFWKNKPIY